MNKIVGYMSFGIACIVIAASFVTATNYTQLALASAVYPALAFFGFMLFSDSARRVQHKKTDTGPVSQPQSTEAKRMELVDVDKRAFLKLIGAFGFSFFLVSLLTKRPADILFPKSAPVLTGDPVENKRILDGYSISELDDTAGDVTYFGFVNKDAGWYIMKETEDGSFRYIKGNSEFPVNWMGHKNLTYDYFHNVF